MEKLHSLDEWLQKLETIHPLSMDFKLSRIQTVFARLNLGKIAPLIITVAGTNGKGSTSTMAAYLFREIGLSVGLFTSPHIEKFNERIRINLEPESDEDIIEAFQVINAIRSDITLTYFEFATLAAFYLFQKKQVDVAILEVGLGGRLDSTNIVDADIAIITPIDIDHTAQLGNTIDKIATEKAGIIKNNAKVVCAESEPSSAVISACNRHNAEYFLPKRDFNYEKLATGWRYQFQKDPALLLDPPSLKGDHQYQNAAAAITAVNISPYTINEISINAALNKVVLAGRFQILTRPNSPTVFLDVTHNPQGARALKSLIDSSKTPNSQVYAVFGMLKDKDSAQVVEILNSSINTWILCPINNERGQCGKALANIIEKNIKINHIVENSINDACKKALNLANNNDMILVFGSFGMINEGISCFKENNYEL